ncbi:MAG: Ldh family oxidoreductase [Pseudomonadota bacterium]
MTTETLSIAAIEDLALDALTAAGTAPENARPLAQATAVTEAMGVASHGLAYVPIYCEHVRCGKVVGDAVPEVSLPRPGVVRVDARNGFAHPAIAEGFPPLIQAAQTNGVAALAIRNSYNCGVLGVHVQALADAGLLGIGFTNAPASIAPSGGALPVVGTNPIALATPEGGLLIDQSASVIAKSEIMKHAREGRPIPEGWALDSAGQPTTDPEVALKGSMAPAGGYKGVGLSLIVEIMAAAMTGAMLGKDASPFSGTKGGPPATGQFFLAIDPSATGDAFANRMTDLTDAIRAQAGARLPGDGRRRAQMQAAEQGVEVATATLDRVRAILRAPS